MLTIWNHSKEGKKIAINKKSKWWRVKNLGEPGWLARTWGGLCPAVDCDSERWVSLQNSANFYEIQIVSCPSQYKAYQNDNLYLFSVILDTTY